VDEALDLIQQVPHAQSRNYLLADRYGKAVVAEATIDGVEVRLPEDGLVATTNHTECPSLAGKELFVPPDSPVRYKRLRALSEESDLLDVDAVKRVFGDRENLVCAHGEVFGQAYGTIWSVVGHVDERQLEIAEGTPTGEMQYQTIDL
jgi:predicted choloylglycine hydrolase